MSKPKHESFYLPARELRVQPNADGFRYLTGTIPYNSPSSGLPWTEVIAPGAFADALKPGADVLCLRDHDSSLLLGRTLSGTLTLADGVDGLQFRCKLPNTSAANDLVESLSRGDISSVSFGFVCADDVWAADEQGSLTRTIRAVDLQEVSVCSFAAYPDARASLRSIPRELRPLVKRSTSRVEDGECECDCPECLDGDCEDCSDPDCDDPNCGCEDGEGRSTWAERTLLRIEVARRL